MDRRFSILSLLLAFFQATSTFAQSNDTIFTNKYRHELEIGYGTPSTMFLIGNFFSHNRSGNPVNIHSQYMYHLSKHFSVGANLTYSLCYKEYYEMGDLSSAVGEQRHERDYWHLFTIGLAGRSYWFYRQHWAMYSKYGLTLSIESDDGATLLWPLNISLVGIEVGGRHWRGYIEPLTIVSMWPVAQIGVKYLF